MANTHLSGPVISEDGFEGDITGNVTGNVNATALNISDIPTSATGLASGDVWSNEGVLTIVS